MQTRKVPLASAEDRLEWKISDENGELLAYKKENGEPVVTEPEKAIPYLCRHISELQRTIEREKDFYNSIFIGIHFGYPPCCIREYLDDIRQGMNPIRERNIPGNPASFIPCRAHTREVLDGKRTLESLLVNRSAVIPFRPERTHLRLTDI